jgi:DNA (cytosine-5)-methyltransferase 1
MQGLKLAVAGYAVGSSYHITKDAESNSLTLNPSESGNLKVSRKKVGAVIYPVIDLCSQKLMDFLGAEITRVCVTISPNAIKISLHPVDLSIKDRMRRLYQKMLLGQPLAMGSLCHGGGILDHALHSGLTDEGINTQLSWLIEMNEVYIQSSLNNNSTVDESTLIVNGTLEEIDTEYLSVIDLLVAGLPCTGASKAGKSSNKIKHAEQHQSAGTAFLGFLDIIKQTKPAVVLLENVLEYQNSLSFLLITERLKQWGYDIHTMELDRSLGAFEDRKRLCMIAITRGLQFNCNLLPSREPEKNLSEMLESIDPDSSLWKDCSYIDDKAERDLVAGKGFKTQLVKPDCEKVGVIGRGYAKYRSTEPMVQHPTKPKKRRLLTPVEHARVKSIPESLVDGLSATIAHQILGQSVLHSAFVSVGRLLGAHFQKIKVS